MTEQIDSSEIEWLYFVDWYDWILSGVVTWKGKRYYADCFDDNPNKGNGVWYRRYNLLDLPEEIWIEEDTRRQIGEDETVDAKAYFEKYPQDKQLEWTTRLRSCPIVGWFEI